MLSTHCFRLSLGFLWLSFESMRETSEHNVGQPREQMEPAAPDLLSTGVVAIYQSTHICGRKSRSASATLLGEMVAKNAGRALACGGQPGCPGGGRAAAPERHRMAGMLGEGLDDSAAREDARDSSREEKGRREGADILVDD